MGYRLNQRSGILWQGFWQVRKAPLAQELASTLIPLSKFESLLHRLRTLTLAYHVGDVIFNRFLAKLCKFCHVTTSWNHRHLNVLVHLLMCQGLPRLALVPCCRHAVATIRQHHNTVNHRSDAGTIRVEVNAIESDVTGFGFRFRLVCPEVEYFVRVHLSSPVTIQKWEIPLLHRHRSPISDSRYRAPGSIQ